MKLKVQSSKLKGRDKLQLEIRWGGCSSFGRGIGEMAGRRALARIRPERGLNGRAASNSLNYAGFACSRPSLVRPAQPPWSLDLSLSFELCAWSYPL